MPGTEPGSLLEPSALFSAAHSLRVLEACWGGMGRDCALSVMEGCSLTSQAAGKVALGLDCGEEGRGEFVRLPFPILRLSSPLLG